PLVAEAQQAGQVARVGGLWPGGAPPPGARMVWVCGGVREAGYVEGRNLAVELRYGGGSDRLRGLAAELLELKVSLIATFGDLGSRVAQRTTPTVPIVALTDDFLGTGLVTSLARPIGNITGVTILAPELSAKRLGLLKEAIPRVS